MQVKSVSLTFVCVASSAAKGSVRAPLCVVRGSPAGCRRTPDRGRARRAPHHEGQGSLRKAAGSGAAKRDRQDAATRASVSLSLVVSAIVWEIVLGERIITSLSSPWRAHPC